MASFFAGIAATLVTVPLIGFVIIYVVSRLIIKNNKKSFFLSVDLTTIFFVIAVHFLLMIIFGKSLFWVVFFILLTTILFFGYVSWKMYQEINIKKVMKGFWRFTFLLFVITYFILFVTGLIHRIFIITIH